MIMCLIMTTLRIMIRCWIRSSWGSWSWRWWLVRLCQWLSNPSFLALPPLVCHPPAPATSITIIMIMRIAWSWSWWWLWCHPPLSSSSWWCWWWFDCGQAADSWQREQKEMIFMMMVTMTMKRWWRWWRWRQWRRWRWCRQLWAGGMCPAWRRGWKETREDTGASLPRNKVLHGLIALYFKAL